jgi:ABC-type molybdate transport system substrate-binding protein
LQHPWPCFAARTHSPQTSRWTRSEAPGRYCIAVGEAVAKGEADFGAGFIPEFVHTTNLVIAGPLPGDTDFSSLATAVVLAGSENAASAKTLIEFLRSPAARKVIRARGMEPH